MNHAHFSLSNEHYTPPEIIEIARSVMGQIDIDPCSNYIVNKLVKAIAFFSEEGLEQLQDQTGKETLRRIWCNPPGGVINGKSNLNLWLTTIYKLWMTGKIEQCFFLFFNREFIGGNKSLDLSCLPMLHFYSRVKYWGYDPMADELKEGNYQKVGIGGNFITPRDGAWFVYSPDKVLLSAHKGKSQAIAAGSDSQGKNYYLWTNSPTHPSSLAYFPPRTNARWSEKISLLQSATPAHLGRWIIPSFPTDLGVKP